MRKQYIPVADTSCVKLGRHQNFTKMTKASPDFPSLKVVLTLILLVISQGVMARDYQVEVVVFERTGSTDVELEVWDFSTDNLASKQSRLVNLSTNVSEDIEFDPVLTHLSGVQTSLIDSGFKVLRSASWIQPPEVFQNAPLVSLGIENSAMPYGFIRVYKTSLIFVDVDLQLSPMTEYSTLSDTGTVALLSTEQTEATDLLTISDSALGQENQSASIPHYFISEKRRVKFKEIHYFDHPRFGAIVGVWPIESSQ